MQDHERTITVPVPPAEAFRFLSSVSNLPSYVPHLRSLREDEDDHVFGVLEIDGQRQEVSGFFRADEANLRLDWESDGTPGYQGWLRVSPARPDESRITVHITMRSAPSETPPGHPGLAGDRIEREFDGVLDRMRRQMQDQYSASK